MTRILAKFSVALVLCMLASCTGSSNRSVSKSDNKELIIRDITSHVEKIAFHSNPSLFADDADEIFSEDLMATFRDAISAEDAYFDADPWAENQDPDPKTRTEVQDVYDIEGDSAKVDVIVTQWKQPFSRTIHLVYEEESWRIDDFTIADGTSTLRQVLAHLSD